MPDNGEPTTPDDVGFVAPRNDVDNDVLETKAFRRSTEGALAIEESMPAFESMIKDSNNLVLVTDLDGTLLPWVPHPKDVKIDPEAHAALMRLHKAGIPIFALTGRAGREAAQFLEIPGAYIIGTAGWEVYKADENDPDKGESAVSDRLTVHKDKINDALRSIRENFIAWLGQGVVEDTSGENLTSEIEYDRGKIVFEKKAVNADFPEGICQNYNFNFVPMEYKVEIVAKLRSLFHQFISSELMSLYEFEPPEDPDPENNGGVAIAPKGGEGKWRSMIQVMRSDDDLSPGGFSKRQPHFKGLPGGFDGVLFFGDTNQDAQAMEVAHKIAALTKRKGAGVVILRPEQNLKNQDQALKQADVAVEQISGNAELLEKIADLVDKYYHPKNSQEVGENVVERGSGE